MHKLTRILFATALSLSILCIPTKAFAKAKIQIKLLLTRQIELAIASQFPESAIAPTHKQMRSHLITLK